jgi:hypothetical protein
MILVAEDNPDDALIFKMKFKRAALPSPLHIVEDGQQVESSWILEKPAGNRRVRK